MDSTAHYRPTPDRFDPISPNHEDARHHRGPLAVAASTMVMLVGAGFLTFVAMQTPQRAPEAVSPVAVAPSSKTQIAKAVIPDADVPTQSSETPTDQSPIAELIAQTADNGIRPTRGVAPSLKPSHIATIETPVPTVTTAWRSDDGRTPSLKPQRPNAQRRDAQHPKSQNMAKTKPDDAIQFNVALGTAPSLKQDGAPKPPTKARLQAMKLDGLRYASMADAPPPVFFKNDLTRVFESRGPIAIAMVQDVARAPGEVDITIRKGETFVDALRRAGVDAPDRNAAAYAFGKHYNLRRLRPGQKFHLTTAYPNQTLFQLASATHSEGIKLMSLRFRADTENRIALTRDYNGDFSGIKTQVPITKRLVAISGKIDGSLFLSAKAAGAPQQVIADFANIFAYDVDFQREIFGGDEFEAIFELQYDDTGALVGGGDILYARLNWRGRNKEKGYYRFMQSNAGADYFDASGQGARRLLMKTPIDGARLSSGFGTRRHPVLGYRKSHKGVDFAAPRGTPIKAAGDGVIERANRYGSFGNYVRIRHANGYKTAYAHLKGFARGMRAGKRVRQGDIIAYVGTTGRSTGPHLHYEVHLRGKAVNPQKLKIATGVKLKRGELDLFRQTRDEINAMRLPENDGSGLLAKDDGTAASL